MRLRFPLWGVMALVLAIAVGLVALRFATDWWASVVFSATLLNLSLAAAYAAQRRGPRRAFWAAFVCFGTGYMVLAFGPWCERAIRPRLATTKLLDTVLLLLHPTTELPPVTDTTVRLWDAATGEPVPGVSFSPDGRALGRNLWLTSLRAPAHRNFQDIGHSLFALLLAVIGGTASRYFHDNRDDRGRKEEASFSRHASQPLRETDLDENE